MLFFYIERIFRFLRFFKCFIELILLLFAVNTSRLISWLNWLMSVIWLLSNVNTFRVKNWLSPITFIIILFWRFKTLSLGSLNSGSNTKIYWFCNSRFSTSSISFTFAAFKMKFADNFFLVLIISWVVTIIASDCYNGFFVSFFLNSPGFNNTGAVICFVGLWVVVPFYYYYSIILGFIG